MAASVHTCAVSAATLIDGHIGAAPGQLLQQAQQLQGEMRQQLLIVVQIAGYKNSLPLRYLRQTGIADARNCICAGPGFNAAQQQLNSCQCPAREHAGFHVYYGYVSAY